MAVGDVVNEIGLVNTVLTFQPAAGVEVLITGYFGDYTIEHRCELTDGVNTTLRGAVGVDATINPLLMKVFINNTNFFEMAGFAAGRGGYCGIQTL